MNYEPKGGPVRIARVVLWLACNRKCPMCCNNNSDAIANATVVPDISHVHDYDQVLLTGGEPMLAPDRLLNAIDEVQLNNPRCKIFLYTALWGPSLWDIIELIDGIHFTLHAPAEEVDLMGFQSMQLLALGQTIHEGKSFRLHLDPKLLSSVPIVPSAWERIENKPWVENCPLPKGETLYILGEDE